jgi:hypothetical protein
MLMRSVARFPQRSDVVTDHWPDIPYAPWQQTSETLHQWLQIVGKYRLAATPWRNHSWHATFYVTARGLTTGLIPHPHDSVQADFDFRAHRLVVQTGAGAREELPLAAMPVATFDARFRALLTALNVALPFDGTPNEIADPIPFAANTAPGAYDADAVQRFWRALLQIDRVFERFRTGFLGKTSPVHLFWGSFDLAVTRFSGRTAPPHPGGVPALPDAVTREAYSHEVSSAGFWPGGGIGYPAFYAYAYPTPEGFSAQPVTPDAARFDAKLGEFLLPYDAVRQAADPEATLLGFLQTSYEAAARLADWDRAALDCPLGTPLQPRAV